jgi:F420-dependent oxidoreductase-like protein
MPGMKLGYHVGYWGRQPPARALETIKEVERLGFDSIWTAESWGSDALTPLAWWGSQTMTVRLGTDLAQLSARTPTAMAMAAITMDHLSGGRFVLGLGVSGPQVVEGWYGRPFAKPLARTREYVSIIRKVLAREERVTNEGPQYPMPYRGEGSLDLGKPLNVMTHPLREDVPIILGAEGPKNVALAAEIADGWFPIFYSAKHERMYTDALDEGFARPGARRTPDSFEILPTVTVNIDDDVERAADALRPMIALYVGGMGARGMNFHYDVFCRLGYEAEASKIQQLFLDGQKDEAVAAVPTKMVEEICLIGPKEKIRDELDAWKASRVTTMLVGAPVETLRVMAELIL